MMMCEEEASWSRLRVCGEAHDRCDGVGVREARSFEPCGAAVCVLRVAVDGSVAETGVQSPVHTLEVWSPSRDSGLIQFTKDSKSWKR